MAEACAFIVAFQRGLRDQWGKLSDEDKRSLVPDDLAAFLKSNEEWHPLLGHFFVDYWLVGKPLPRIVPGEEIRKQNPRILSLLGWLVSTVISSRRLGNNQDFQDYWLVILVGWFLQDPRKPPSISFHHSSLFKPMSLTKRTIGAAGTGLHSSGHSC